MEQNSQPNFYRQRLHNHMMADAHVGKWSREILREGFVPFPKKLLRTMHQIFSGEHGVDQLAVVLAIVDYLKSSGPNAYPSIDYLGFVAGYTRQKTEAILDELKKKSLVEVEEFGERYQISIEGLKRKIEELTEN